MRGSVSILLVLAMLLAASISAVAFAVSSDEGTDVAVTNEVYVPVPAEEAPAEAPPVISEPATEEAPPAEEAITEEPTTEASVVDAVPNEVVSDIGTEAEVYVEEMGIEELGGIVPAGTMSIPIVVYVDDVRTGEVLYFDFPEGTGEYEFANYDPFWDWFEALGEARQSQGLELVWLDYLFSDEAATNVLVRLYIGFETLVGSAETTPTAPAPPVAGDSSTETTPSVPEPAVETTAVARATTAGPKTGDSDNWFVQIAAVAALVATFAAASLCRTREQDQA
ncbi:MAG: hypothetical protein FWE48_05930 [Coriobacteriia bacterium]|nr:hypothetical protein [Coriobacteriia bacterium]